MTAKSNSEVESGPQAPSAAGALDLVGKVKILNEIRPRMSGDQYKVAAALLLYFHNTGTGNCFPSYRQLATASGTSPATAVAAIKWLEREGWIAVQRSDGGRNKRNTYCINVRPAERLGVSLDTDEKRSASRTQTFSQPKRKYHRKGSQEDKTLLRRAGLGRPAGPPSKDDFLENQVNVGKELAILERHLKAHGKDHLYLHEWGEFLFLVYDTDKQNDPNVQRAIRLSEEMALLDAGASTQREADKDEALRLYLEAIERGITDDDEEKPMTQTKRTRAVKLADVQAKWRAEAESEPMPEAITASPIRVVMPVFGACSPPPGSPPVKFVKPMLNAKMPI